MKKSVAVWLGILVGILCLRIGTVLAAEKIQLQFTPEEQAWLAQAKEISLGVLIEAPPYEYIDDGVFKGITSSYIRVIEEKTGISFKIIPISDWHKIDNLLENGEIEVLSLAVKNFKYSQKLLFTRPYLASSLGIFGNYNTAFINNFDDVAEQKVAVSSDTLSYYPRLRDDKQGFEVFENPLEAMRAVNDGKVDLYVGDIVHTKFTLDKFDLRRLRYIAPVVGSAYSFSIGVVAEDRILLGIMDKVLAEIPPLENFNIRQKWTSLDYGNEEVIRDRYLSYLYLSFILFVVLLFLILYRSRVMRKKATQMAHHQKMESIGRLAGGVAHDFNNMLAGIRGAAEIMGIKCKKNDSLQKYIDIILNACERSSYLTSQLLVFSREKGHKNQDINLHECLQDGVALLEHGISKKVRVKTNFAAENHFISGNCNLLQSMLLNLGFNAQDAMNGKGIIELSTRDVELKEEDIADCVIHVKPKKYIEIIFKDNGHGISENIRAKIFEPFFTTKEVGKGTGLGLAAVYGIVREHKGTIRVKSSPEGTAFHIYLPIIVACALATKEHKTAQNVMAKVMVVDDEKMLLELMGDILKLLGAEVLPVNNSVEAAEVYRQNLDVDVVMLDVIMPEKGGLEVLEELRQINPLIKVIFMSGYDKDNEVAEMIKNDENLAFINKPYTMADCQEKISKMLAK